MRSLLILALLGASLYYAQAAATFQLQSGRVVDLDKLAAAAKGQCCIDRSVIGDTASIIRMDGSKGRYYVTNDPNCGNRIYASSYPTTYSKIYVCGQCKGDSCKYPVDGGKTLVYGGGQCVKADGSYDISKICITTHPVCQSPGNGQCVTLDTPPPCTNFANLGEYCDEKKGNCCGGAPKNAKCENNKCVSTAPATPATFQLQSGKVIDLVKLAADAKGQCCIDRSVIGDTASIIRMDGSKGKYYVTNDPNCGNVIYASSYPTTYSKIYVCGQCKGDSCKYPVDGGKTLVYGGGQCVKADGSYDISKICVTTHPVCQSPGNGQCVTLDTPPPCTNFANLGEYCDEKKGNCCGGAPKNAKCENNKCVSTTQPPAPGPAPVPKPCTSWGKPGGYCEIYMGRCCEGKPNSACVANVCRA